MTDLVFCHHDLGAEHILVDASNTAVAVIDWGDANRAPWWFDFTGLWLWGDELALRAALDAYGRLPSAKERQLMQHQALLAAIGELHYDLSRDPDSAEASESRACFIRAIDAV